MANSANQEQQGAGDLLHEQKTPVLHVAVGVIIQDQKVLVSFRHGRQHQGGKWEFPGGKCEAGESVLQALTRELQEELGILTRQASPFMQIRHSYPERDVLLDIWQVTAFSGEPRGLEGQPVQWVPINSLSDLTFPEANLPIIEKIQHSLVTNANHLS